MNNYLSIQIKAAFLLFIFSLNMGVGFACALGMNMQFNSVHQHETGTKPHEHDTDHKSHPTTGHHDEEPNPGKEQGGCCHDKVVKISQSDKYLPHAIKLITPPVNAGILPTYFNTSLLYTSAANSYAKYFPRNYHPPIPDIILATRSFRI